jgi:PAS domain S-box-containing protein
LQAKIRRLVDSNIIGIVIWASDGTIIDANDTYLRIVGYTRHDFVTDGLNWKKLTPTEWLAGDTQRVSELEATGNVQPYEKSICIKTAIGSRYWSAVQSSRKPRARAWHSCST